MPRTKVQYNYFKGSPGLVVTGVECMSVIICKPDVKYVAFKDQNSIKLN